MLRETLIDLYEREFERLNNELNAYSNPEDIWKQAEGINNSGGNLSLHLAGNLQHFIGAVLGKTGYIRDREFEFNGTVSFEELIRRNEEARKAVHDTLKELDEQVFHTIYPLEVLGQKMSTTFFMTHLYGHFNYHLGQINYHRRLISEE